MVVDTGLQSQQELKQIYPLEWRYIGREDFAGTYKINTSLGNSSYKNGDIQPDYSICQTNIILKRLLTPYIYTFFLPLSIIITVFLLVLFFPKDRFDATVTIIVTALLCMLVFHSVAQDKIPSVGYLVKVDLYFILSYVFIITLFVEYLTITLLERKKKNIILEKIDRIFMIVYIPIVAIIYILVTFLV